MRNLTYTPDVPYPQRQLFLCVDTYGRLCAASAQYTISGNAADGAGSFFDWLTTADGGHTFVATPVPVDTKFRTQSFSAGVSNFGAVLLADVSRQTGRPLVFSTVGNRIAPTGSGETAADWQRQLGADSGYGEYYPKLRTATKSQTLYDPINSGETSFVIAMKPGQDANKYTWLGGYKSASATGGNVYTTLFVFHSYDVGRSVVQSALFALTLPAIAFTNPNAYTSSPPRVLPYMTPAKEKEAGVGPGLMPRCRLYTSPQDQSKSAWQLLCICGGQSADTLYALGSYYLAHPDGGNVFLGYYLIKSMDCGQTFVSFDPAAPAFVPEKTYAGPNDPPYYAYDLQADGTYQLHAYPPIVFPVCSDRGLPPSLPSQPSLPQGDYASANYTIDPRKPQMVFAQGTLYAALPATQIALLQTRNNAVKQVFSYALTVAGEKIVKEISSAVPVSGPLPTIPQSAFDWVLMRSADLGRTWERLTSPPPMQYGALAVSQNGHRLHFGLHAKSDDGGHTWDNA